MKNAADITCELEKKSEHGGAVFVPAGEYTVEAPVLIDVPSTRLAGEVWAYNLDPNGVFETRFGSKLRLKGRGHPAVMIGSRGLPAGCMVHDIGIQGDIVGMDTRGMFDPVQPWASAGLYFGGERVDQGDFRKISCCGLAVGVSMAERSEIDACDFNKIYVDGCCVGVYFAPRASYYARFHRCIVADNPSYGFWGTGAFLHTASITDTHFVRNCGCNHIKDEIPAAVLLKNFDRSLFSGNLVDCPGTFWYYSADAVSNSERQVIRGSAVGLYLSGKKNRILNNVFENSSRESVIVCGDENILMGNIADGDVVLEGNGNVVNGLVFTRPKARLILRGAAAASTVIMGVEEHRVVREA